LQRISELRRGYDPLQYPLILSHGTDGWHINLKLVNSKKIGSLRILLLPYHGKTKCVHAAESSASIPAILGRFLLQIETEYLQFIRRDQKALHADCYQDLRLMEMGTQAMQVIELFFHHRLLVGHVTCMNGNKIPWFMLESLDHLINLLL